MRCGNRKCWYRHDVCQVAAIRSSGTVPEEEILKGSGNKWIGCSKSNICFGCFLHRPAKLSAGCGIQCQQKAFPAHKRQIRVWAFGGILFQQPFVWCFRTYWFRIRNVGGFTEIRSGFFTGGRALAPGYFSRILNTFSFSLSCVSTKIVRVG